ncbi:MAG TPA: LytTR family DNA-binding domain-containing protein [Gammaproteobacteria bacterium]|nr:LytTR family DNA-binding domain-containing protein [Gammaproteobacteria bacterium]
MNRKIKCIVCDDEHLGRQNIKQALLSFPGWELVAELENGRNLVATLDRWNPDIVFLDIRMPGKNGIDLMRDVLSRTDPPEIIFVTAFDHYAIQAFELYALDYILKPFDEQRFARSIERAEKAVENKIGTEARISGSAGNRRYLSRVFIPSISKIEIVDLSGVYAFVANGNYVDILLEQTKLLHRCSMKQLEQNLDPDVFIRCHRSSIVRIDKVTDVVFLGDAKYEVVLSNNTRIKMSGTYKDPVMAALEKASWSK